MYRRFARSEAAGRSRSYQRLADDLTDDPTVLGFVSGLPADKRQPNLVFAAARYLLDRPIDLSSVRDVVGERADDLTSVILTRRTQTNKAARCATLLPALTGLRPPLTLLEVGAAAGLTLLVDRYSCDYDARRICGTDRSPRPWPATWCGRRLSRRPCR